MTKAKPAPKRPSRSSRKTPDIKLSVRSGANDKACKAILDGLNRHNIASAGPYHYSQFTVAVTDAQGRVRGGVVAEVYFEAVFIKLVWLSPTLRGRGIATQFITRAEREAKKRGARLAYLDTFSFQARPLYEKLGYRVFGTLKMPRKGVSRYYMAKRL